jgi:flavin-dependent dehydrogenase
MDMANVTESVGPLVPLRYDVVVAGGGSAGMVAAIAAARAGAKTLLVERGNCLGGTATAGLIVQFGGGGYPFMTGIMKELLDDLIARGEAVDLGQPNVNYPFDPDGLKDLAFEKLSHSGADLLLYSPVVGELHEGTRLRGVLVENKSGRCTIEAKVVVDATGDADVVARSGAEVLRLPSGGILGAIVGNIDFQELRAFVRRHPDHVFETDLSKPLIRLPDSPTPSKRRWRGRTLR